MANENDRKVKDVRAGDSEGTEGYTGGSGYNSATQGTRGIGPDVSTDHNQDAGMRPRSGQESVDSDEKNLHSKSDRRQSDSDSD